MLKYFAIAKILFRKKTQVDNFVFFMHYRLTFIILVICSLLVTASQYFGPPMRCTAAGVPSNVINTYCYFTGTYSVPSLFNRTLAHGIGPNSIPYPGVGLGSEGEDVVYHHYYQWVSIVLFLQAIAFYFPHHVWKNIEGSLLRSIIDGLECYSSDEGSKKKKIQYLLAYVTKHQNLHINWSIRFFICEALNFVNVITNLFLINWFLGGNFFSYGSDVMNYPENEFDSRADPMSRVFPKMAKCTFRKFGPSGTMETHDAFCLLAVNIINQKIYLFLWFWLIILSVITGLWLIIRGATFFLASLRFKMLQVRGRWAGYQNLKVVVDTCSLGDWFLIYQMGAQMEPGVFGEFIKELAKELQKSAPTLERKPMLLQN